jgi:hydrogenase expression/formation protein HypE
MKVVMAHGSGGNATRELIRDLFHKYLANEYLDKMEDAASLPGSAYPLAMTTDSFVITPLEFPGGDIGKLAVCGTVNDLWMSGAEPQYLTAGFILEEGLDLTLLERVVASLSKAAREAGVKIVAAIPKWYRVMAVCTSTLPVWDLENTILPLEQDPLKLATQSSSTEP